jgi:TPR repeat protein
MKKQSSVLFLITMVVGLLMFSLPTMAVTDFENTLRLAKQGDAQVQFELGRMYMKGKGVKRDDEKALHWYKVSANEDNQYAQTNLGRMFENGIGVDADIETAIYWHGKAADNGYSYLKLNMAMLSKCD